MYKKKKALFHQNKLSTGRACIKESFTGRNCTGSGKISSEMSILTTGNNLRDLCPC